MQQAGNTSVIACGSNDPQGSVCVPTAAAVTGSGSSWFTLRALKMSAVAWRERDQMMRRRGKWRVSRHNLLIRLCCCSISQRSSKHRSAAVIPRYWQAATTLQWPKHLQGAKQCLAAVCHCRHRLGSEHSSECTTSGMYGLQAQQLKRVTEMSAPISEAEWRAKALSRSNSMSRMGVL